MVSPQQKTSQNKWLYAYLLWFGIIFDVLYYLGRKSNPMVFFIAPTHANDTTRLIFDPRYRVNPSSCSTGKAGIYRKISPPAP